MKPAQLLKYAGAIGAGSSSSYAYVNASSTLFVSPSLAADTMGLHYKSHISQYTLPFKNVTLELSIVKVLRKLAYVLT